MITIQGFAKLCGCNTQTLRYYDRIGLLTPAKVDQWTGYRYYEEEQAVQFVKIKNLQQADFSIEEIRPLLKDDEAGLAEAFDRKIREKEQELEKIRNIRRSYLEETMMVEKMLKAMTGYVRGRLDNPVLWKEFGLDREGSTEVTARATELLADWLTACRNENEEISVSADGQQIDGMENIINQLMNGSLDEAENFRLSRKSDEIEKDIPADAKTVFVREGWDHIHEWIDGMPDLGNGKEKFFLFRVRPDSPVSDHGFPTLVLAVMAARFNAMDGGMACKILLSDDGQNHFELRER